MRSRWSRVIAAALAAAITSSTGCRETEQSPTGLTRHDGRHANVFDPGDPSLFGVGVNQWDPPSFAQHPRWGLVTYADHEAYATHLAKTGAKWIRMDIWGIDRVTNLDRVEYTVNLARSKRFSILANLKGGDKVPTDSAR